MGNQVVQGVKQGARMQREDGQQWGSLISTPRPTAWARGTKEPWRRDSKGQAGTASTSGHVGAVIATQKDPKPQISGTGWVFPLIRNQKNTSKGAGASPSLEVTWPGSVASAVRPFLSRDEYSAVEMLQCPHLPSKTTPQCGWQKNPSLSRAAPAALGGLNLEYQAWSEAGNKPEMILPLREGFFFSFCFFPSVPSWKCSCLPGSRARRRLQHPPSLLGNVSNSSLEDTRPRDSWRSNLTWVSGQAAAISPG